MLNTNKNNKADAAEKRNAKIKETWSKLSDDDVNLYDGKRNQFFAQLKEKHNVSEEDGKKKLQEIEKACSVVKAV